MSFGENPRLYPISDKRIIYAGRTDLNCLMSVFDDIPIPARVKYTIDFKTGTKPKAKNGYAEWPLQTAAYRYASKTQGNGVVHLDKETGEMTWFDYSTTYAEDLSAFLSLTAFWRNRNAELLDGTKAPSVTTITGILDKSGPLMWWAVNSMRDYIFEQIKLSKYFKGSLTEFNLDVVYQWVEEGRKNFRKVSKKAMDIGTKVHDAIEQWIKHKIEPTKDSPDEVIAGFVAFLDWWEKHEVEAIETEKVIYGRE